MWERIALAVVAVIFLLIMLGVAIFLPEVTPFQVFVFRTVLAITAAAAAAFIPGFIEVEMSLATNIGIRAGGAIAVFVVVYAVNPPLLVSQPKKFIHQGTVANLENHINGQVTDFSLILGAERQNELRALYINETIGDTWGELFSKICERYAACIRCTPPPNEIDNRVQLVLIGPPLVNHPNSTSGNVKMCPTG